MSALWRAGGEESTSTDDSESQGWSDAGWRDSPTSSQPRASLSSSGELPSLPAATSSSLSTTTNNTAVDAPAPPPRGSVSFSSAAAHSLSHRRQTITRPVIHTVGSNLSLDTLTPLASRVVNMDAATEPASSSSTGSYPNHPPPSYVSDVPAAANGAYSRSHRKSVSIVAASPLNPSDDEPLPSTYHPGGHAKPSSKTKKRNRAGSFTYLPFHRRSRRSSNPWPYPLSAICSSRRLIPSRRVAIVAFATFTFLFWLLHLFRQKFEIQLEFSVFSKHWVRHEIDMIKPLRGCFDPKNISPLYNVSQTYDRHQLLAPGIAMRRGMSCYDFSSTIQPLPDSELQPLQYHTYWRSDLLPFGSRQSAALTAFLATQPLSHSKIIIWSNGADEISASPHLVPFLDKWGDVIEVRQVDMTNLTKGTELEGKLSGLGGGLFDERAWVDGDAVRLLVLWHFGGVWMDMDQILTRDLHPLAEAEFVTQWDCYDKPYFTLNGAVLHFRQHSPYLCEAFHIMASSPFPQPNTFAWGSFLYSKLHRRLISAHITPFTVLPWCFTDPRNCRADIRFPDPFEADPEYWAGRRWDGKGEVGRSGREVLEEKVGAVWSVHLHNQWRKGFPRGGWVERLIDGYRARAEELERWRRGGGAVRRGVVLAIGEEEDEAGATDAIVD